MARYLLALDVHAFQTLRDALNCSTACSMVLQSISKQSSWSAMVQKLATAPKLIAGLHVHALLDEAYRNSSDLCQLLLKGTR